MTDATADTTASNDLVESVEMRLKDGIVAHLEVSLGNAPDFEEVDVAALAALFHLVPPESRQLLAALRGELIVAPAIDRESQAAEGIGPIEGRLGQIRFTGFRGLPELTIDTKGKNYMVVGANGAGKSAIVDGLEFLFGGAVGRFIGTGSGDIEHDQAIGHIKAGVAPNVKVSLSRGGSVSRTPGSQLEIDSDKGFAAAHARPASFILRRNQITDFIEHTPADRMKAYVKLLGLEALEKTSDRLAELRKSSANAEDLAKDTVTARLGVFAATEDGERLSPASSVELLDWINRGLLQFKLEAVSGWSELGEARTRLQALRVSADGNRISELNGAILKVSKEAPAGLESVVIELNRQISHLAQLRASSEQAQASEVVDAGLAYFEAHSDVDQCPLCEQSLSGGYAAVLERLKAREKSLRDIRAAEATLDDRWTDLSGLRVQLVAHKPDSSCPETLLTSGEGESVASCWTALDQWLEGLPAKVENLNGAAIGPPPKLDDLAEVQSEIKSRLEAEREKLISTQDEKLESLISLVANASVNAEAIETLEQELVGHKSVARRCATLERFYRTGRKKAFESVLNQIAEHTVECYNFLHGADAEVGSPECQALQLKTDAQSRGGGVRLAVDFFSLPDRDPKAFLSEGHLDSLGLALYLASVRCFNRPGSLLVLDDVLTSIDSAHRQKFADLLTDRFGDYQIILTTHELGWFESVEKRVRTAGLASKWTFDRIVEWSLEGGPVMQGYAGVWDRIEANMNEGSFRDLGGPLRIVSEDFYMRVAEKTEFKMPYKHGPSPTIGNFLFAGFESHLKAKLGQPANDGDDDQVAAELRSVFGCANLVNDLSHNNPIRNEIAFNEFRDYVNGLKALTKRCERLKLIKGAG